ncbi:MAG: hypothetical protein R3Y47_07155 [Lachnospiraceae bacterium]
MDFSNSAPMQMFNCLFRGDYDGFKGRFLDLTEVIPNKNVSGEDLHMLFLGMCIGIMNRYEVNSRIKNADSTTKIVMKAKLRGDKNYILGFKCGDDLKQLAHNTICEIIDNDYTNTLIGPIIVIGVAKNDDGCEIMYEVL